MEKKTGLSTFPPEAVFALDIGTRSIIGMVGVVEKSKVRIIAVEEAVHSRRTMVDGQIENIDEVAALAAQVRENLENRTGYLLKRVCVAAAGRALQTSKATFEIEFPEVRYITEELISELENGAIEEAEKKFEEENKEDEKRYYLVGYTVSQYYIDNYMISSLREHRGRKIKADVVATFLPGEVVESLYTAMSKAGMEVASLTLEPIAAINAAIPEDLRLLNLVMVDVGAGTSDIAVCRDGKVVGYTMATLAGDEITEALMKELLVDFSTAEKIKMQLNEGGVISYTDILGFEQQANAEDLAASLGDIVLHIGEQIAQKIIEVNGSAPSALFLAGGGSRTNGLKEKLAECLGMDARRVSVSGRHFAVNAFSDSYDIQDPKYTTPLGIVISAGLNMINDCYTIKLNGNPAKLFSNGSMTVTNILLMNGYMYRDLLGKSGANVSVLVNGKRVTFYGEKGVPAVLELNGADAGMNDIVHAGDEIIFHPAQHGKAAKAVLSDLPDLEDADSVRVNGEEVSDDVQLFNGDVIEIIKHEEPQEEALEDTGGLDTQEEPVLPPPAPVPPVLSAPAPMTSAAVFSEPDTAVSPGQTSAVQAAYASPAPPPAPVSAPPTGYATPAPAPALYASTAPAPGGVSAPAGYTATAPSAGLSEPAAEKSAAGAGPVVRFEINGRPLLLKRKDDGSPYYLMDMLQYSGIDFAHVTAQVILEVNGESVPFQHELRNNDRISIYQSKDT